MTVRHALLAILVDSPLHAYQLRQEFERRTGGTWPLNIGQVYQTLQRLARDGLAEVRPVSGGGDGASVGGEHDVDTFVLTAAGRAELDAWWNTPVARSTPPARDELVIKLALAVTVPGVDVASVVQRQRTETMRALHSYTQLKSGRAEGSSVEAPSAHSSEELAWSLVLDNLIFVAEAELRWLDHVETRLVRARASEGSVGGAVGPDRSRGQSREVLPAAPHARDAR